MRKKIIENYFLILIMASLKRFAIIHIPIYSIFQFYNSLQSEDIAYRKQCFDFRIARAALYGDNGVDIHVRQVGHFLLGDVQVLPTQFYGLTYFFSIHSAVVIGAKLHIFTLKSKRNS